MKLSKDRNNLYTGLPKALLEHNGEELAWNAKTFDKSNYVKQEDPFEQINGFWAYLPPATQDKIFNVYKKIFAAFEEGSNTDTWMRLIRPLVTELFQYHDLADVKHWMDYHSSVRMPNDLDDVFSEKDDGSLTRERTYLKEDYRWLIASAIALRCMLPILGEFISRTGKEIGNTFKEYHATKLLAFSNINNSEPMERLRTYVARSIPADKSKASAALDGISSEDFPEWILGMVIVRRILVSDLSGNDPDAHLIKYIHSYIKTNTANHDSRFLGLVKDKINEGVGQEGETNLSRLENYKTKESVAAGDIALIAHYAQDIVGIAKKICPDIDLKLVEQSQESVQVLLTKQIWEPQIVMIQWVLKSVIPPRGILQLPKTSVLQTLAVAQALLWHRGYKELAALSSAIANIDLDEMQLSSSYRARITKEQQEELAKLYPFARRPSGKQKETKRVNEAENNIETISKLFSQHEWRLTLPNDWIAQLPDNKNSRRFFVPHDIKIKLADLSIALAKRSF